MAVGRLTRNHLQVKQFRAVGGFAVGCFAVFVSHLAVLGQRQTCLTRREQGLCGMPPKLRPCASAAVIVLTEGMCLSCARGLARVANVQRPLHPRRHCAAHPKEQRRADKTQDYQDVLLPPLSCRLLQESFQIFRSTQSAWQKRRMLQKARQHEIALALAAARVATAAVRKIGLQLPKGFCVCDPRRSTCRGSWRQHHPLPPLSVVRRRPRRRQHARERAAESRTWMGAMLVRMLLPRMHA